MTPVPDIDNFSLSDVCTSINSESSFGVSRLKDCFKYSKSPEFDPAYGDNINVNSMSEFRNYKQYESVYREPRSEIVTDIFNEVQNNIALFPNNEVGYSEDSSIVDVIDAQYDIDGEFLYAITSNTLYCYDSSVPASGASANLEWDLGTPIYTMTDGDTFSTKIQETFLGRVFIGTNQGRLIKVQNGAVVYVRQTSVSDPIIKLDTIWYHTITAHKITLWLLKKSGNIYYSDDYGETFLSYNIGVPGGANLYTDFTCCPNMTTTAMLVRCNDVTYYHDHWNTGRYSLYGLPSFFKHYWPIYGESGQVIGTGEADRNFLHDNMLSLYTPNQNFSYGSIKGVIQVWVDHIELYEDYAGFKTYYTGYMLLNIFFRKTGVLGWEFYKYNNYGKVIKNTDMFNMYQDGNIRYGYVGADSVVNPLSVSDYFAAAFRNNSIELHYPAISPTPTTTISLTASAQSSSFGIVTNYSHYRVVVDKSGESWFVVSPPSWSKNNGYFTFAVPANTTGEQRFVWIHILNADSNIIVISYKVFQAS